jgi:Tectonin domain
MFGLAQRIGLHRRASRSQTRRPHSFHAGIEAVEDRVLLSTLSAINWFNGAQHSTVFGIGSDDSVYMSVDGHTPWVGLGGYAKQISAGLDTASNPEVFAIGSDNALYVNDGGVWNDLGGYVKQISATANNTVFAIGTNDGVFVNKAGVWSSLGGYAQQISASVPLVGNFEVFAIGTDNALYVNDGGVWNDLGGYVRAIAAPAFNAGPSADAVYGIGSNHGGFLYQGGFKSLGGYLQLPAGPGTLSSISWSSAGVQHSAVFSISSDDSAYISVDGGVWQDLGGYVKQISAGLDAAGNPEVFAIGSDNALYVNDGGVWNDLGGYVK